MRAVGVSPWAGQPHQESVTEPDLARIEVEGAAMAVRVAGRREHPTLLLLHGFASSSLSFRRVIRPLARQCFVVAPDLPGFGASDEPTPDREVEATAHLSLAGTRDQYVGGVPADVAKQIDPRRWQEDWRIMSLPGRLALQRALVLDYRSHVARFGAIADYLHRWQPPALMLWGRHDAFFDIQETVSWMKSLPRMEAHILDGPHFLLETHAAKCAAWMGAFLRRVEGRR